MSSGTRNHFRMGSAFLQAGYPALALPYLRESGNTAGGQLQGVASDRADRAPGRQSRRSRDLARAGGVAEEATRPSFGTTWEA